jgi:hypothetical protein
MTERTMTREEAKENTRKPAKKRLSLRAGRHLWLILNLRRPRTEVAAACFFGNLRDKEYHFSSTAMNSVE